MQYSGRVVTAWAVVWLVACTGGEIRTGLPGEDCQNQLDDDGDGLIDCGDDSCAASSFCPKALISDLGPEFEVCGESIGDRSQFPVDMIWILDSSPSMKQELASVANNLNHLDEFLQEKRANVRVMLLGGPDVCVLPPLGGPNCTNGERFLHIAERIGNQETLRQAAELYPQYKDFLRPGAQKAIVAVSDDNPNSRLTPEGWPDGVTAETFTARLETLDGSFPKYVFHSIVAFPADGGLHPTGCNGAQRQGDTYLALSDATGGLKFSICNNRQGDWQKFLGDLATSVAGMVNVPCAYPRTLQLQSGERTSPTNILVEAEVDGQWKSLPLVPTADDCADHLAWTATKDEAIMCPAVCKTPAVSTVRLKHGCPAGVAPD